MIINKTPKYKQAIAYENLCQKQKNNNVNGKDHEKDSNN